MSSIFTGIFGGGTSRASRESQAATQAENTAIQRFIEQQAAQARGDVSTLFPEAQRVRTEGFQGALDVIGAGVDPQLAAFQAGNVGAQRAISAGLPQFQAAIMGQAIDPAAFAPTEISADTSHLRGVLAPDQASIAPIPEPERRAPFSISRGAAQSGAPARQSIFDIIGNGGRGREFNVGGSGMAPDGFGIEPTDAQIEAQIMRGIAARGGAVPANIFSQGGIVEDASIPQFDFGSPAMMPLPVMNPRPFMPDARPDDAQLPARQSTFRPLPVEPRPFASVAPVFSAPSASVLPSVNAGALSNIGRITRSFR